MSAVIATPSTTPVEADRHYKALDGLRAIAVMSVFAYHLHLAWIPGGFLGVDLFFVLSGFLITGLLWRARSSEKGLSLRTFYERRFRRLLPALALMLLAVCAWAYWIARPEQIIGLREQGLGSVFYVANWVFINQDQSYFAQYLDPSILMHTWSLAIEEQFYLVWPLLLLLLTWKWRRNMMPLVIGSVVLAVASVVWMLISYDAADPFVAYLGTFSRIHELLIGGLASLAVIKWGPSIAATLGRLLDVIAWLALVGVLVFMFTLPDSSPFYYRGGSAVFAVVAAVLLMALTLRTRGTLSKGLSLGPVVWIGLVSYGIYLWHWPVIVWLTPLSTPLSGWGLDATRIAVVFAIAAVSFYAVEMPIRKGRLVKPRAVWIGVPATMAVLATTVFLSTANAAASVVPLSVDIVAPTRLEGANDVKRPDVMVVGDSVPAELMDTIGKELKDRNLNLVPVAFGGCSVVGLYQLDATGKPFTWSSRCTKVPGVQSASIKQYKPKVVVWYSGREKYGVCTLPTKDGCSATGKLYAAGTKAHRDLMATALENSFKRLTSKGARLVIVLPTPRGASTSGECLVDPTATGCSQNPGDLASVAWMDQAYTALQKAHPKKVRIVSMNDVLCPGFDPVTGCGPEERQGSLIRHDGVHITSTLEKWFVNQLFERVEATGFLPK